MIDIGLRKTRLPGCRVFCWCWLAGIVSNARCVICLAYLIFHDLKRRRIQSLDWRIDDPCALPEFACRPVVLGPGCNQHGFGQSHWGLLRRPQSCPRQKTRHGNKSKNRPMFHGCPFGQNRAAQAPGRPDPPPITSTAAPCALRVPRHIRPVPQPVPSNHCSSCPPPEHALWPQGSQPRSGYD